MTDSISPPTVTSDLSMVVCGYCATNVRVNETSGEIRAHKRRFANRRIRCIGSGQMAYIYPGHLREGDEFQVVGEDAWRIVDAQPIVPRDSNVWQVPAGGLVHLMRGDLLLRLWTRQAGER